MAKHLKGEKKIVRGYSLRRENAAWLKRKAVEATLAAEGSVSASEILDRVLEAEREREGKAAERKTKRAGD